MTLRLLFGPALLLAVAGAVHADEPPSRGEVAAALRKATEFFHGTVASRGGYVYRYSADLSLREGEGTTGETTVWVQPPGTPADESIRRSRAASPRHTGPARRLGRAGPFEASQGRAARRGDRQRHVRGERRRPLSVPGGAE